MPAGTSYTFKEGMLSDKMKKINSPQEGEYYELDVKNQFLHAVHPIGWIKKLEIELDGQQIEHREIYFVLRGQWFAEEKMHTISEVFWNLSEAAQLCFVSSKPLDIGKHHIKCTFTMSMLEDTQVLDRKEQWPNRVEFIEGDVSLAEEQR